MHEEFVHVVELLEEDFVDVVVLLEELLSDVLFEALCAVELCDELLLGFVEFTAEQPPWAVNVLLDTLDPADVLEEVETALLVELKEHMDKLLGVEVLLGLDVVCMLASLSITPAYACPKVPTTTNSLSKRNPAPIATPVLHTYRKIENLLGPAS